MQPKRPTTQFTGEWEIIPPVNPFDAPPERCGHTLTIHGSYNDHNSSSSKRGESSLPMNNNAPYGKLLVTFGESSLLANREYYDDMHLFDLTSSKWVKILGKNIKKQYKPYIKTNFNPIARADHASCAFGRNLSRCLLFGGKCQDTYLDDLIVIKNICNFPINRIEKEYFEEQESINNGFNTAPPKYSTNTPLRIDAVHLPKGPTSRRGASLCTWKEGAFLVFGGQRGAIFFNDLWGLDLYKQGWVELSTRRNPMPRAFHSAFVDSQHQMLILGGVKDTQAHPTPADIYKLDLRAGKFFKLGDKDMVPGLLSALGKGHHTSHFLNTTSDLIIYSPQSASCHLLGGNVKSEHCGRCTSIVPINDPPKKQSNDNNNNQQQQQQQSQLPLATCRPATALLPSNKSCAELKTYGCSESTLDRIFVHGGYSAHTRKCSSQIYSMKFSSTPCLKNNHKCKFSKTPSITINKPLKQQQQQQQQGNIKKETAEKEEDEQQQQQQQQQKQENLMINNRLSNVTPMRTKPSRSRIDTPSLSKIHSNSASTANSSMYSLKKRLNKRVSIIETPVRCNSEIGNTTFLRCFESEVSRQKISGALDPELTKKEKQINSRKTENKTLHWQFIDKLLLNFNEDLLDQDQPFIFEPHEILQIIFEALPLLEAEPTLLDIDGPCKIFGDIHGQLGDLMSLFKAFGYPDTNVGDISFYKYIFLGDFVDRGQKSLEIICLLLALKIEYPTRIYLVRGNHECHAMNELYGFYHEIHERLYPNIDTLKYLDSGILNENISDEMEKELAAASDQINLEYEEIEVTDTEMSDDDDENSENSHSSQPHSINKKTKIIKKYKHRKYFRDRTECINYLCECFELLFRWLPLSVLIESKILCVHGGIGRIETIEEIASIQRPVDVVCDVQQEMNETEKKVVDLLWSDPAECDEDTGFQQNKRGVSCVFGSDIVRKFCNKNNIDLIIRGHQVVKDGYEYFAGGHLITLFSATNYCNVMDNAGAILCISDKLRVLPKLCEARPLRDNILFNEETNDNDTQPQLQWKELKDFPPSPMRNADKNDMNNKQHEISIMFDMDDNNEDENNGKKQTIFHVHQNNTDILPPINFQ